MMEKRIGANDALNATLKIRGNHSFLYGNDTYLRFKKSGHNLQAGSLGDFMERGEFGLKKYQFV